MAQDPNMGSGPRPLWLAQAWPRGLASESAVSLSPDSGSVSCVQCCRAWTTPWWPAQPEPPGRGAAPRPAVHDVPAARPGGLNGLPLWEATPYRWVRAKPPESIRKVRETAS